MSPPPHIEHDPRRRWPNPFRCAVTGVILIYLGFATVEQTRWLGVTLLVAGGVVGFGGLLLGFIVDLVHYERWRLVRRRTERGRCVACGYDLTGNVSGVCPECGAGG